jgi:hypothetical protein
VAACVVVATAVYLYPEGCLSSKTWPAYLAWLSLSELLMTGFQMSISWCDAGALSRGDLSDPHKVDIYTKIPVCG